MEKGETMAGKRPGWVHETIAAVRWEDDGDCVIINPEGWHLHIEAAALHDVTPRAGDRYSMYVRDTTRTAIGQPVEILVIGEALIWDVREQFA